MMQADPHFGALLRRHRLAANLSQEALAARAGLSREAVSALERGTRRAPRPETVGMLADALALDCEQRGALGIAARDHQTYPAPPALPPSYPVITTKVRPPQVRQNLVARPRLRHLLGAGRGGTLTLVSAPAGFGKTTLLGDWLGEESEGARSVAWVSVDEGDNDVGRFFAYLIAALRASSDSIGEGVLAALCSPESPPVRALMGTLLNELANNSRGIVIVLDDYHLIDAAPIHDAISFLVEHAPENVHLVISTRADPLLPLPGLRARNRLTEVRAADLRFTPEEAAAFLREVMGLTVSARDAATLAGVTEGWVAALQLAALSMLGHEDIPGFVAAFSGSNRHVLDYLAAEVLGRQPDAVRNFLLQTAVLERMTAPLCDALTGHADGQGMLEQLERENLFVVPLDDERCWYRYHHLFADFLRARLDRQCPERARELHCRASRWYEENGPVADAIWYALAAPDHDLAARLIESATEEAIGRGEFPTVLRWLDRLPRDAKRRFPRLFITHAVVLTVTGRTDDVEPLLREAEGAEVPQGDRRLLLGYAAAVRSWRALLRGDAPAAASLARSALIHLRGDVGAERNLAAICLGDALRAVGDLAAAGEAFTEAIEVGRAIGHVYGTLTGMAGCARVQAERGHLREADDAFRRTLRVVREQGADLLPAAGLVHIGMGTILYERDDLDAAERELKRGIALAERTCEVGNLVSGYITLSRVQRARGDEAGALATADAAGRVARDAGADCQIAIAGAWMARLHLVRGDLARAASIDRWRAEAADGAAVAARSVDRLTSARLLCAQGRNDEALRLLAEAREAAEATGRMGELIETLALEAIALRGEDKATLAAEALARALALAESEGYVRTFVDEGPAMAALLSEMLDARQRREASVTHPVHPHYARKILSTMERGRSNVASTAVTLPEPLSEREKDVLHLIAVGMTNRQIAAELFVGEGTVKTHAINIYRKLDAHSRTHALAKARSLQLI